MGNAGAGVGAVGTWSVGETFSGEGWGNGVTAGAPPGRPGTTSTGVPLVWADAVTEVNATTVAATTAAIRAAARFGIGNLLGVPRT